MGTVVLPDPAGVTTKPDIIPAMDQDSFSRRNLDPEAWSQYFPYQLIIMYSNDDGSNNDQTYDVTPWRITLPIPPQELDMQMQVADTLVPTLTGYAETSGGAPFRNILMAGTTGVWPTRTAVATSSDQNPITTAVAPLAAAIGELVTGAPPRVNNPLSRARFPDLETGYWHFHRLRTFLEAYVAMKTSAVEIKSSQVVTMASPSSTPIPAPSLTGAKSYDPRRLRLALAIWKDDSVYLCRLGEFTMRRSADRPLEYRYSLQLQAFKRIDYSESGHARSELRIDISKASRLLDIMNRINAVRKIIVASKNLLQFGVLGTLAVISEISRQFSGAVKDVLGVARSVLDLPSTLASGILGSVLEATQSVMAGVADVTAGVRSFQNLGSDLQAQLANIAAQLGVGPTTDHAATTRMQLQGTADPTASPNTPPSSFGSGFVDTSKVGTPIVSPTGIDPSDVLDDASLLLADTTVDQFVLSSEQQSALQSEIDATFTKSVSDFQNMQTTLQQNLDVFTAAIGSWDPRYNDIYGLPQPPTPQRVPTPEEQDVLFACNDLLISTDQFVSVLKDSQNQVEPPPSSLEFIASLAQQAGIFFQIPKSKFAVPFPFGHTLERLALQYLGDANRWHEIAALNNLREPYVDEEGFAVPLLTNANGRQITVATAENLFVGQQVFLTSNTQNPVFRNIIDIDTEVVGQAVIMLDGDDDLNDFRLADRATLRAFLPGTVNSRSMVYIPSTADPVLPDSSLDIPGVNPLDPLIRLGGIDLLLADNLDLVVTPNGDNPLAVGMVNMTQTIKLALSTKPGSLMQHPTWGFDAAVGDSVADVSLQTLANNLQTLFGGDLDFAGIRSGLLQKVGNVLRIDLQIALNGFNRLIPISLSLGTRVGQS